MLASFFISYSKPLSQYSQFPYPLGQVANNLSVVPTNDSTKFHITPEQQEELLRLGFMPGRKNTFDEDDFLTKAVQYSLDNHICSVDSNYRIDNYPFGKKMQMVKNGYLIKQGLLSQDTPHLNITQEGYDTLLNLGLLSDIQQQATQNEPFNFEQYIKHYQSYQNIQNIIEKEEPNYVKVGYVSKDGFRLWQCTQALREAKAQIDKNQPTDPNFDLTEQQWQTLEDMHCLEPLHSCSFNQFCDEFQQYKAQTGSSSIPKDYITKKGLALGEIADRYNLAHYIHSHYEIPNDDISQSLEKLGFVWYEPNRDTTPSINSFIYNCLDYAHHIEPDTVDEKGNQLGKTTMKIYQSYLDILMGQKPSIPLTAQDIDNLNMIEFGWKDMYERVSALDPNQAIASSPRQFIAQQLSQIVEQIHWWPHIKDRCLLAKIDKGKNTKQDEGSNLPR